MVRRGIVVHNDESAGIFLTLVDNKILITLESPRMFENFMALAEDGGATFALLVAPTEEADDEQYTKTDNERRLADFEGFRYPPTNTGSTNYIP
jgi:hypothetical protein